MCGVRRAAAAGEFSPGDRRALAQFHRGSHGQPRTGGNTGACQFPAGNGGALCQPIDFASLQAANPDIYGWLEIPGTEFDFPLVQRQGDDSFYLTHDSDGNESSAGAIFTESAYNSTTMEDPVTVAYGHQMHAGTMFGKLQETYSQENALEDYGEVIVYLPEKELHYQVFAAVPYDNRHILYNYDCTDSRRFNAFLNSIYEVREIGAQFNSGVTVSTDDKVLVLSTCLAGNSQRRYLSWPCARLR